MIKANVNEAKMRWLSKVQRWNKYTNEKLNITNFSLLLLMVFINKKLYSNWNNLVIKFE